MVDVLVPHRTLGMSLLLSRHMTDFLKGCLIEVGCVKKLNLHSVQRNHHHLLVEVLHRHSQTFGKILQTFHPRITLSAIVEGCLPIEGTNCRMSLDIIR